MGGRGSGKTMAARRFIGLLPDLREEEAVQVASLHSLSGILGAGAALRLRPPFRAPHHSASLEGLIGGGRRLRPGEISLAHEGILFLDEAAEFHADVLQALREPMEEGRVSLVRAGSSTGPNPQHRAIQSPSTPSMRQPLPYWYFGPSLWRMASASGE